MTRSDRVPSKAFCYFSGSNAMVVKFFAWVTTAAGVLFGAGESGVIDIPHLR